MILVDSAAGSSPLLQHPPLDTLGIPAKLPSPPFSDSRADIFFEGNGPDGRLLKIGVETKKITEFVTSLLSGRLQATQIPALLYLYDIRWILILTGTSRRNPVSGVLQTRRKIKSSWEWLDWTATGRTIQYSYIDRFLMSPSFQSLGIGYDRVWGEKEAAAWIGDLYEVWQKPYHRHSSMKVLDRSGNQNGLSAQAIRSVSLRERLQSSSPDPRLQDPSFAQRVRSASSLPGMSYTRSVALAEAFPSVQALISPACKCRENGLIDEVEEEAKWSEVKTTDSETGKQRRLGKSLAKEIGRAVR